MALDLSPQQKQFVNAFAKQSGLDPFVVAAWLRNEEPAISNNSPRGAYNFLNIGITDSGSYATDFPAWTDPTAAGTASAQWMQGKISIPGFGMASAGIRGIARAAGMTPTAQIAAIQNSGWASGGETALPALYSQATGTDLTASSSSPSIVNRLESGLKAGADLATFGVTGNPISDVSAALSSGGVLSGLNPFSGISGAIKDLTMKVVFAFAIGGGLLLMLLALAMIGADVGLEQLESRPIRATRRRISSVGIPQKSNADRESQARIRESQARTRESNAVASAYEEEKKSKKEQKSKDRKAIKANRSSATRGDIPF